MKYKLHSIKNNRIFCDVLDDDDNLLLGNYTHQIKTIPEDIDLFFATVIYPRIAEIMAPKEEDEIVRIDASPILQALETSKEAIKFDLIEYIKTNPEATIDQLLAYTENQHGWENAGLAMKMIAEYVRQAAKKELISPLAGTTKEYQFTVLKQIIINTDIATLREMLK